MQESTGSTENTAGAIHGEILQLIVDKDLAPGAKINQAELAKRLHSSRTPIVKSLHRLEAQGLVKYVPNRGFYVSDLSVLELMELFTLREALDSIIVYELAGTITSEQLQQIQELMNGFERTAADFDEESYREFDQAFHSLLLKFSRAKLVKRIINDFQIYNRCFGAGLLRKPQETLPEHRALYDALMSRDRDAARDAVARHMANTKLLLHDLVNRLRQMGVDPATIRVQEIRLSEAQRRSHLSLDDS